MTGKTVRIGGASGYWGDSYEAPRQLVEKGDIDYLVFDYLAEVTMSILVRAKAKNPEAGYAVDFVEFVMKPLLADIVSKGIKVIVNSGGVNVAACAAALDKVARERGIDLTIGTVEGDDVLPLEDEFRSEGVVEMFKGTPLPERLASANAYLGAFPIAAALDAGAQVVITGRCVDSAVTLGPLIHEFAWTSSDFDKLAAGTLAGHIIECGAQATGGNFTDWRDVADDWHDMGYPIAECSPNGTFIITKPKDTGGLVSRLSVGEQVLYEIGDPAAYIMPDVVCDFSQAVLEDSALNEVRVTGVRGRSPTATYKVSATHANGYRATALSVITGFDCVDKANACGKALIDRTERLFERDGYGSYTKTAIHLIGAETLWGENVSPSGKLTRELVLQIDVAHKRREAVDLFSREATGTGLSMATGRGAVGPTGRPKVTPIIAQYSFLIDKARVPIEVKVGGRDIGFVLPEIFQADEDARLNNAPVGSFNGETINVPLIRLAVARSGDKGDAANIGVMARDPEFWPILQRELTSDRVGRCFSHFVRGNVSRFELPGMMALNFFLTEALDGGGTSSLYLDSQAKTWAQILLAQEIPVPREIANNMPDGDFSTI